MAIIQRCVLGLWDSSIPGIKFDKSGISNYAKMQQQLMNDFPRGEKGENEWQNILTKIKTKGKKNKYDCIIGVSGGTDSSYLLHLASKYGLRPLAVNFDNGWSSEIAVKNIKHVTSKLKIDLETYVVNYEEMKDIHKSFIRANLPWIDGPTDLAIQAILYKISRREKTKYILIGTDFRSEGKQPTEWTYCDYRLLRNVHSKYGEFKIKNFPVLSLKEIFYYGYLCSIKLISPFNYINYDKESARNLLTNDYDWHYYGEHHHENIFTKWAISYWLYVKFNIDKRIITYSAQVLNDKIPREIALNLLNNQPFNYKTINSETSFVLKKLGISLTEFKDIWNSPVNSFKDYPSYYSSIIKFLYIIIPIVKLISPTKPKFFYELENRQ